MSQREAQDKREDTSREQSSAQQTNMQNPLGTHLITPLTQELEFGFDLEKNQPSPLAMLPGGIPMISSEKEQSDPKKQGNNNESYISSVGDSHSLDSNQNGQIVNSPKSERSKS